MVWYRKWQFKWLGENHNPDFGFGETSISGGWTAQFPFFESMWWRITAKKIYFVFPAAPVEPSVEQLTPDCGLVMGDQKPAAGGWGDPYFIFHISSYLIIFPKTPLDCERIFGILWQHFRWRARSKICGNNWRRRVRWFRCGMCFEQERSWFECMFYDNDGQET